jgi:hypothetical protein
MHDQVLNNGLLHRLPLHRPAIMIGRIFVGSVAPVRLRGRPTRRGGRIDRGYQVAAISPLFVARLSTHGDSLHPGRKVSTAAWGPQSFKAPWPFGQLGISALRGGARSVAPPRQRSDASTKLRLGAPNLMVMEPVPRVGGKYFRRFDVNRLQLSHATMFQIDRRSHIGRMPRQGKSKRFVESLPRISPGRRAGDLARTPVPPSDGEAASAGRLAVPRRGLSSVPPPGDSRVSRPHLIGPSNTKGEVPPDERPVGFDFETALNDCMARHARLPPSGMTGFDPRVSPAWAGVQIPG